MLKVGVAIPCYIYHLPKLRFLLESIANQTIKPDYVVVSCSSTKSDNPIVKELELTFPFVEIYTTEERKNAAENRNIASRHLLYLSVDIISYIDADDMMYSQRLEFIKSIFEKTDASIVLHSYDREGDARENLYNSSLVYDYGKLVKSPSGCAIHIDNYEIKVHHAQSSIRSEIFNTVKYREEQEFNRREDSVFCGNVLELVGVRNVYIPISLSLYIEEGKTVDV